MVLQMRDSGYAAEFRPFGHDLELMLPGQEQSDVDVAPDSVVAGPKRRSWLAWLRAHSWFRRR
jgi:hypothetical protein